MRGPAQYALLPLFRSSYPARARSYLHTVATAGVETKRQVKVSSGVIHGVLVVDNIKAGRQVHSQNQGQELAFMRVRVSVLLSSGTCSVSCRPA